MSVLRSFRQWVARAIQNSGITTSRELAEYLTGRQLDTEVGIPMNPDTAMRLSTVYSCVRVLAEDVAKLPLIVYQRIPRGKERADDHWLTKLLRQPNPWQTGFEFREMQQAHIELSGNFYALKTVVGRETREMLPIPPARMCVEVQNNWSLKYTMTMLDGTQQVVPNALMYHQRGLSLNGFTGVSPVAYQSETIGYGVALRRFGSRLFRNGANVGGVLEHPGELSEPAWRRLKESFDERYSSLDNSHKVMLLEEGTKFTKTGIKPDEAQFLESRKLSRAEICGIYRVPPHMIADLDRSTNNNIEQQSLDYVQNGLLGRVNRLEARMALSLLGPAERDTYFVEHLLDGLKRGDFQARMNGYRVAVMSGWMTRNQVRELENMNPGPPELDEYLVPLNMSSSKALPDPSTEREVAAPPGDDPVQPDV